MKIEHFVEASVVQRPSKQIRSPYVADVVCDNDTGNIVLAHSAALGCCGLSEKGATVWMTKIEKNVRNTTGETTPKCEYRILFSVIQEKGQKQIIGIYPKLAEQLVENALKRNALSTLRNIRHYRRETTIQSCISSDKTERSRFDFTGVDENGTPFILEVKSVPLADYEDIDKKNRKHKNYDDWEVDRKIAYFPDGFRKQTGDTISPRALKHMRELAEIKRNHTNNTNIRCIMCYVIQRTDVMCFQPSYIDTEYRNAFQEAVDAGVEMITMVIRWTDTGDAYLVRDNLDISSIRMGKRIHRVKRTGEEQTK